jgi:hypothetical protein
MDYLFWGLSTLAWSDLAICFLYVSFSFFNYFIQRKRNKGGPGVFIVIAFLENILFCFVRSFARSEEICKENVCCWQFQKNDEKKRKTLFSLMPIIFEECRL